MPRLEMFPSNDASVNNLKKVVHAVSARGARQPERRHKPQDRKRHITHGIQVRR